MIAAISPAGTKTTCNVNLYFIFALLLLADRNFEETLNTLQLANRAKNIQNKQKKNENNPARVVKGNKYYYLYI